MTRRPICLACCFCLCCCAGRMGWGFLLREEILCRNLKEWAKHAPKATICGEVEYSADTICTVCLSEKCLLIRKSRKIPIEHVRAFLKRKKSQGRDCPCAIWKTAAGSKPRNPGNLTAQAIMRHSIFLQSEGGRIQKESKDYAPWKQFFAEAPLRLQNLCSGVPADRRRCSRRVLGEKQIWSRSRTSLSDGRNFHVMAISGVCFLCWVL